MTHQTTLEFATGGHGTLDITAAVADAVAASGLRCGVAHVFVQHTSCSLMITENADPDVRRDLETLMARRAPAARHPAGHLPVGTPHRAAPAPRGRHRDGRLSRRE